MSAFFSMFQTIEKINRFFDRHWTKFEEKKRLYYTTFIFIGLVFMALLFWGLGWALPGAAWSKF